MPIKKNNSNNINIALVGDGIAARMIKFYLSRHALKNKIYLTQYYSQLSSPCSLNTTATVALRNTKKGVSRLGDFVVDSHQAFENFIKEFNPDGILKEKFLHAWDDEKDQVLRRRYSDYSIHESDFHSIEDDCYIIEPSSFLDWIHKNTSLENVDKVNKTITSLEQLSKFDRVYLCTGAYGNIFNLNQNFNLKTVQGSYLEVDYNNKQGAFDKFGFIEFNASNFVYQRKRKKLLIGATSNHWESSSVVDHPQLIKHYENAKSFISDLPKYEDFKVITGLRVKGKQRLPLYGQSEIESIYYLNGLYRNGWSYPFLLAPLVVENSLAKF